MNVTDGRSAILGEDVWVKMVVGGEEKVVRGPGGVKDFREAPWGLKSSKDLGTAEVKDVQSCEFEIETRLFLSRSF